MPRMPETRRLRDWIRKRLRDARCAAFNTAPEFAAAAHISVRHVYKIENGISSPTVETLAAWLKACDTDLAEFFRPLANNARLLSEQDRAIFELFQRAMLVPEKRAAMI